MSDQTASRQLRADIRQLMKEVQLCDLTSDELRDMIAVLTAARHRVAATEASKVVRLKLVRSAPAELER
jgi:hypothetical protein